MSDQEFLIWQDVAYQAEAHLLAHGQRLPVETRMILAGIRDVAVQRADAGRRSFLGEDPGQGPAAVPALMLLPGGAQLPAVLPPSGAPRATARPPVPARGPHRPRRLAACLGLAALVALLPVTLSPVAPTPALHDAAVAPSPPSLAEAAVIRAKAKAPADDWTPQAMPDPVLAANPLYAPAEEAALAIDPDKARTLQRMLRRAVAPDLAVDGLIGPRTRDALARWQAAEGHVPTGHFTPETVAALKARVVLAPAPVRSTRAPRALPPPEPPAAEPGCPRDAQGWRAYGHGPGCDAGALVDRIGALVAGPGAAATPAPRWDR